MEQWLLKIWDSLPEGEARAWVVAAFSSGFSVGAWVTYWRFNETKGGRDSDLLMKMILLSTVRHGDIDKLFADSKSHLQYRANNVEHMLDELIAKGS